MKKICNRCKVEKLFSDFAKDSSVRSGIRSICKQCDVERVMAKRAMNIEASKEKQKKWREDNQDYIVAAREEYKRLNPDADKKYYASNKEAARKKATQWKKKNSARWAMLQSARRARVANQTPKWACDEKIKAVYLQCAALRERGEDVQVDHIVPLNGKTVSGLHCEANLQIISSSENSRKKHFYWPDMPEERIAA